LLVRASPPDPPSTHFMSDLTCLDSCPYHSDDDCDDGGRGSEYGLCSACTDCHDCGPRAGCNVNVSPPPPPSPRPLVPFGVTCDNTCQWTHDSTCDDGGVGSEYDVCAKCTDCDDCGNHTRPECSVPHMAASPVPGPHPMRRPMLPPELPPPAQSSSPSPPGSPSMPPPIAPPASPEAAPAVGVPMALMGLGVLVVIVAGVLAMVFRKNRASPSDSSSSSSDSATSSSSASAGFDMEMNEAAVAAQRQQDAVTGARA